MSGMTNNVYHRFHVCRFSMISREVLLQAVWVQLLEYAQTGQYRDIVLLHLAIERKIDTAQARRRQVMREFRRHFPWSMQKEIFRAFHTGAEIPRSVRWNPQYICAYSGIVRKGKEVFLKTNM